MTGGFTAKYLILTSMWHDPSIVVNHSVQNLYEHIVSPAKSARVGAELPCQRVFLPTLFTSMGANEQPKMLVISLFR